jgi:hypothetical protein
MIIAEINNKEKNMSSLDVEINLHHFKSELKELGYSIEEIREIQEILGKSFDEFVIKVIGKGEGQIKKEGELKIK